MQKDEEIRKWTFHDGTMSCEFAFCTFLLGLDIFFLATMYRNFNKTKSIYYDCLSLFKVQRIAGSMYNNKLLGVLVQVPYFLE